MTGVYLLIDIWYNQRLFSFAVGAEDVFDFVLVEAFHFVASRAEVFAGVELCGLFIEYLTHGSGHSQTAVRVDVDLAYIHSGCLAELLFGNTDGVGKLAAVFVDDVNVFLRN